ncbi:MAG: ribose 5-phosphate isomerase A [Candidatus Odinarchaeum yellowstonii]|uniref:Ribose-5-phosphate isomerase A n=1 Tax=Odinarchaeota yellowstonii (strain LCB_4) TaxID=1841599 RepID=A0AAF0D3G3_ODILC|nr:MAG: ribose 5-phosphate isomerase A [Candidatus Odinarchaeum yellowstonii]
MSFEHEKELVGRRAAELVEDGQVIGVGSGTTISYFIKYLGERCRNEGLKILAVPSSYQSYFELIKAGVALTTLDEHNILDLTIDGADEADEELNLIKGGGGALTQEKIIGTYTKKLIILIDSSKLVKKLGRSPIPVEVLPKALSPVYKKIELLGGKPEVRMAKRKLGPVITDNGNFILDCKFEELNDLEDLNIKIKMLPGVVETGLFIGLTDKILVGKEGSVIEKVKQRARPDLNR